jgi:hypothetical protein
VGEEKMEDVHREGKGCFPNASRFANPSNGPDVVSRVEDDMVCLPESDRYDLEIRLCTR